MAEINPPRNHFTPVQLPVDIIQSEILPRLPAASVARFKCVSKEWRSFLSTQYFQKMHRQHARDSLLLIDHPSRTSFTYDSSTDQSRKPTTISYPISFKTRRPFKVLILASLDGLICACMQNTHELVLWNPLTRAYNKLSNSKSQGQGFYNIGDVVGLYVDSCNDYKILHIKRRWDAISAYVYSRRLDSWRKIKFLKNAGSRMLNIEWSLVTFSGKNLYFKVREYWSGGESWIVGFDVDSEKFREIQLPKNLQKGGESYYLKLVEIEKFIHLCVSYGKRLDISLDTKLDLWRLMDDGGDEYWSKVASFPNIRNIVPRSITLANCYRKWIVIEGWSKAVFVTDMNTEDNLCLCRGNWFYTFDEPVLYIETLVSPNALINSS